jgi:lipopolysaccharide biosynthesis glycosyltransferase
LDTYVKNGQPGLEGMPPVEHYFNAGVLLIDLDQWRRARISERALEHLAQHPRTMFGEQDALNVACDGLWKKLDQRWNFQDHHRTKITDLSLAERPIIVHFVTSMKPWKPSSISVNASLYDSFRGRTCFAKSRREQVVYTTGEVWSRVKRRFAATRGRVERFRTDERADLGVSASNANCESR